MIENHMVLPVYEDPTPPDQVENDYHWFERQHDLMIQQQREEELRQIIKQRIHEEIQFNLRTSRLSILPLPRKRTRT